jgi:hypothetical protein
MEGRELTLEMSVVDFACVVGFVLHFQPRFK